MDVLIHHTLQASTRRAPEKEALVHGDQRLSYAELLRRVAGLAAGLREAGLSRLDRVGIHLDPSVPQVVSMFGAAMAGGVYVPINHQLFPDQVGHIVNDAEMTALITTPAKLATLAEVLATAPSLRFIVVVGECAPETGPLPRYAFDDLCATVPPEPWAEETISKDLAAILYTSGSTGKPKGVMLSHAKSSPCRRQHRVDLSGITERPHPGHSAVQLRRGNEPADDHPAGGTLVLMTFRSREIVQMLRKERSRAGRRADALNLLAQLPTLASSRCRIRYRTSAAPCRKRHWLRCAPLDHKSS